LVPNNFRKENFSKGSLLDGDGAVVVGFIRRTAALNLKGRTFVSKAGLLEVNRGSDIEKPFTSDNLNIKSISNLKNVVTAYELIKSKPGNMTKGVDNITLDGINSKYFEKLQSELKAGKFTFKPARRIQIPKPGKSGTRPLTIASPREKIVQKALLLVLERFYESKFLYTSHGFRPQRGTHTAMRDLEAKFQSVHYVIEADFSKAFDTIQHSVLLNLLRKEIKCEKTLTLIKSGLKAGYIEFGNLHNNLSLGTPQGSIMSPLLCNIFLNELDIYMEKIKSEYKIGNKRKRAIVNEKLQNKVKY
jgi:group II intron reverse transcriptase/maturase